ncbi:MAG TPA: N-acetylmuramidase domain-containing protein, partial [Candidatus Solibacter sp.]
GFGYLTDRRPAILFERHFFHRLTDGKFDDQAPSISCSMPGGYLGGAKEYDRLAQAIALDRHAALSSASWGIGQIMGSNFAEAGFASVEDMVNAMVQSEDNQLTAMARFVCSAGLSKPLGAHDWAAFARGYNGPGYAKNQYDTLLGRQYQMFAAGPLPDIRVRQAQALLTFLGIDPGGVDGMVGKRTRAAVMQFRGGDSDQIDDTLIDALTAALTRVCLTPAAAEGAV